MTKSKIAITASLLALAGCDSTPVQSDFGKEVREVAAGQTLNPATRANPSDAPVLGADAYAVDAAIEAMRKDVGERDEVKSNTLINIGTNK